MTTANYYNQLPKKQLGAGVLFFNKKKELLIVKPKYRPKWLLPGGVVEKDESPRQAIVREVREELGLKIKKLKFICVDYKFTKGEHCENLQFIFLGGVLDSQQIKKIKLDAKELITFDFVKIKEALKILNKKSARRLTSCLKYLKKDKAIYLENGKKV